MLYRIYTQDKRRRAIAVYISQWFDSFTFIPCVGYYRGYKERSLIIEIGTERKYAESRLTLIANFIATINHQRSVIITQVEERVEVVKDL